MVIFIMFSRGYRTKSLNLIAVKFSFDTAAVSNENQRCNCNVKTIEANATFICERFKKYYDFGVHV